MKTGKTRKLKKYTALLLCASALLLLCAYSVPTKDPQEGDFAGKDAQQLIEDFLRERNIPAEHIAIGYRNEVTGEEYILNGDLVITSASLYKVPLNMYWAEKVYNGEITMDESVGKYPLWLAQEESLIHSSNRWSMQLWQKIGNYSSYRQAVAPYYGLTAEEASADREYLKGQGTTVNRMLCCMQLLYSEPERYPGVLECLLQAEPEAYFRTVEDRFPIAQKYGNLSGGSEGNITNTAGILYTQEPFLLVVLTENTGVMANAIGDLAQLLCSYTQYEAVCRYDTDCARMGLQKK